MFDRSGAVHILSHLILNETISPGFKFIGNTALDLVREGYEVPFGYEEAIGYMFGSEIRDKDGVSASVCPRRCVRNNYNVPHAIFVDDVRRTSDIAPVGGEDCMVSFTRVICSVSMTDSAFRTSFSDHIAFFISRSPRFRFAFCGSPAGPESNILRKTHRTM